MEAPERIWIAPVHGATRPDDFYLIDPEYRNGRGVEYIRADLLDAHIGAVLAEIDAACSKWADECGTTEGGEAWAFGEAGARILALHSTALTALDRAKREARVEMFEQIWAAIERLHVEATAVDALNAIAPIIRALIEAERGKP